MTDVVAPVISVGGTAGSPHGPPYHQDHATAHGVAEASQARLSRSPPGPGDTLRRVVRGIPIRAGVPGVVRDVCVEAGRIVNAGGTIVRLSG